MKYFLPFLPSPQPLFGKRSWVIPLECFPFQGRARCKSILMCLKEGPMLISKCLHAAPRLGRAGTRKRAEACHVTAAPETGESCWHCFSFQRCLTLLPSPHVAVSLWRGLKSRGWGSWASPVLNHADYFHPCSVNERRRVYSFQWSCALLRRLGSDCRNRWFVSVLGESAPFFHVCKDAPMCMGCG